MSLLLGLEYENELPPRVRDELEQLIASIQTGFNGLNGQFAPWVDVPYSSASFRPPGAMTWTVDAGDQTSLRYQLAGKTLTVTFSFINTTVGGTPGPRLDLLIPNSFQASKLTYNTYHYIDNGTYGIGLTAVSPTAPSVIQLFKTDFTANWSASASNTAMRGTIIFEVQ